MVYSVILLNFNTAFKYKMNIKKYFEYTPSIDLNAAQIGINKWEWIKINSSDEVRAKEIMQNYRFDVLPIVNRSEIKSYFATQSRNDFSNIAVLPIREEDMIYYRMSFEDLIRKFDQDNRFFYFLTNHQEVLGLVSRVNLNSQPVYSYLFQLIVSIEKNISEKLDELIDQDDIIKMFESSSDPLNQSIVKNFKEAVEQGKDNSIFQHMYLQNIGYILNKFSKKLDEKLSRLKPYKSNFSPDGLYNKIRRNVMHPVRPIYNGDITITEINQFLSDYHQIMDILIDE